MTIPQDFHLTSMRRFDGALAEISDCASRLRGEIERLRESGHLGVSPDDLHADYHIEMLAMMVGRLQNPD